MAPEQGLVSRRTVLKTAGSATFVGATGLGAVLYSSRPVIAAASDITEEDVIIETVDGGVSRLGVSDLWFELEWQHIRNDVRCYPTFVHYEPEFNQVRIADEDLGISGSGTDIFGFGDEYEDVYNVDLGTEDYFGPPPHYTEDEEWLAPFQLEDREGEKTVTVELQIRMADRDDDGTQGQAFVETLAEFDVIVRSVDPSVNMTGGAALVFGEE